MELFARYAVLLSVGQSCEVFHLRGVSCKQCIKETVVKLVTLVLEVVVLVVWLVYISYNEFSVCVCVCVCVCVYVCIGVCVSSVTSACECVSKLFWI